MTNKKKKLIICISVAIAIIAAVTIFYAVKQKTAYNNHI